MTELSRRHVLLGGLTLAAVAATSEKPALADPAEPPPSSVEALIQGLEQKRNASIGVFATNLVSDKTVAHRAQEPFAM
jgi:beta-lactamase class A